MGDTSKREPVKLDRREFLAITSGALGIALAEPYVDAAEIGAELPTHRFRVRRDADLLSLEFRFVNFERRGDVLHALGAGRSLVIVRFPPQNLAEARFDKTAGFDKEPDPNKPPERTPAAPGWEEFPIPLPKPGQSKYSPVPPVATFLSGPSWVVFVVPDLTEVPLNMTAALRDAGRCCALPIGSESVLDVWLDMMGRWPIRVPANAVTPGRPGMPAGDETCLEIPFRLFIAPRSTTTKWISSSTLPLPTWAPRPAAVELWHAALHDRKKLTPATPPPDITNLPPELAPPKTVTVQARAVFSPDYQSSGEPPWQRFYPGNLPLSHRALVRHLLVKQMTEGKGDGWIDAEHLILSSLGADASLSYFMQTTFRDIHDAQLKGDDKTAARLAIWKHRMVVGRDVFLLSVWTGFLMPLVFPTLLVELTRRTFVSRQKRRDPPPSPADLEFGPPGAYLLTEYFLLVQDPVKQFSGSDNVLGRKMPIKKATILETRSPLIQLPDDIKTPFVPRLLEGGAYLRWPIEFEDEAGRRSRTSDACLLFAANVVQGHNEWPKQPVEVRKWSMPAQRVGLAPDKAQLIVPAGDRAPAVSHSLMDAERIPASKLANDFREDLGEQLKAIQDKLPATPSAAEIEQAAADSRRVIEQQLGRLKRLVTAPQELPPKVQAQLAALGLETQRFIAKLANELATSGKVAEDVIEEVMRQLARAEQAATDVEVHAIEFGSRRVDKLFKGLEDKIPDALTNAISDAVFLDQLKLLETNPDDLKRLAGEVGALWEAGPKQWVDRRRDAIAFLNGIKAEGDRASDYMRHGFQPLLEAADIIVPALKATGGATGPQEFKLLEAYAAKGIDQVQNSVFGAFSKTIDDGRAMADRIKCAVASPAVQIAGLSRDLGALTGQNAEAIKTLAKQAEKIDLRGAIPDFKLLGVLPLAKIVFNELTGAQLPTINMVTLPDHIEQIWEWNAKLTKTPLGILTFVPAPEIKKGVPNPRKEPVHLYIKTTTRVEVPKPGAAAPPVPGQVHLEGLISFWNRGTKKPVALRDTDDTYAFSINLLDLIDIKFLDLSFEANYPVGGTPKPKVKPRLGVVEFLPPLDFVKKLQDALPFLGKGFDIVQTPARIGISYEFQVPAIAFGAFSMRNLAIGSAVLFSLEGKPLRFDFNFSSWKEPFELTVLCFGGRGFLKVAADTSGYRELQGMLEFGGALSFDVVVASGGLYVMAGIYFRVTAESTTVAGFLRAGGTLNVLGLIHASVEFLLMASYIKVGKKSKLAGEASVTVSIDLFLVSFDVTVRMYKEFEGSGDDDRTQQSALDRHGRVRRVAFGQRPVPVPAAPDAPLAYFTRPQPVGPKKRRVRGRFDTIRQWDEQYWSQFAIEPAQVPAR